MRHLVAARAQIVLAAEQDATRDTKAWPRVSSCYLAVRLLLSYFLLSASRYLVALSSCSFPLLAIEVTRKGEGGEPPALPELTPRGVSPPR